MADIYGVVSVGNITDLDTPVFAVTENDFGGVITVNLLAVNDTSNGPVYQPSVEIDESVSILYCKTLQAYTFSCPFCTCMLLFYHQDSKIEPMYQLDDV